MSFNWNNAAENAIVGGLGMVPEVGSLLSAMVYIFWPTSGENVWSEIEKQVEQLINQEIAKNVKEQVTNDLAGLNSSMADYLSAVKGGDLNNIAATWAAVDIDFDQHLPDFQWQGHEVLLLPLFAQFANLNLAFLRDGALFGSSWGWNSGTQQAAAQKLVNKSNSFFGYANGVYSHGLLNVQRHTASNPHKCEPFRSVNTFTRHMTLSVLDFSGTWPFFPSTSPIKNLYIEREIYSDPMGSCDDSGSINLPNNRPPSQPISQIQVWAEGLVQAVQVTYPAGGGPNGVTQTPVMGGTYQGIYAWLFSKPKPKVTVAAGCAGTVLNAFIFSFSDQDPTGKMGGQDGSPFSFSYPGEILSSIHINGKSNYYDSADCVVFGFMYERSSTPNSDTVRTWYISSPSNATFNEIAAKTSMDPATLAEVTSRAAEEDWDSQRQQYWNDLKSRTER